ncbi:VOC family protein [Catenulispora pinisilvae]|uniref:VOC family protein n=1 Tax=Catenulispora pinisilvae TaxID=2705253 RepID=UPI001E4DA297|nr:VOC family protein [Catenulispora pinisilvae]
MMTDITGIPTARAVDHYAFTVPDLDEAVALFTEVFRARLCYLEGPIEHPEDDWMERKLGVHPRASARIAMMRFAGSNLEIFEYSAVDQNQTPPSLGQPGAHYIAIAVTDRDRDRVLDELCVDPRFQRANFGNPRAEAEADGDGDAEGDRTVWLRTRWGMHLAITDHATRLPGAFRPPAPKPNTAGTRFVGIDHVGYTVADLTIAESFFRDVLGARLLARETTTLVDDEVLERMFLRAGPTANIALLGAGDFGAGEAMAPVRNSDVGGHHLAIHVDDVDAAAAYLARQPGVEVMGAPETVAAGPIAGDRWVYFRTPIGLQMEIINLPDGSLPYERTTSVRRAVPPLALWNEYR